MTPPKEGDEPKRPRPARCWICDMYLDPDSPRFPLGEGRFVCHRCYKPQSR